MKMGGMKRLSKLNRRLRAAPPTSTGGAAGATVALAWLYFALRVAHSLVHLTYNNVFHRLGCYAASSVVLAALWLRFAAALLAR